MYQNDCSFLHFMAKYTGGYALMHPTFAVSIAAAQCTTSSYTTSAHARIQAVQLRRTKKALKGRRLASADLSHTLTSSMSPLSQARCSAVGHCETKCLKGIAGTLSGLNGRFTSAPFSTSNCKEHTT